MANILILGSGRSSSALIHYLLVQAPRHEWTITVGDISERSALEAISGFSHGEAVLFDIRDEKQCAEIINRADIVISLLPPPFHPVVATHCLARKKHLLTASYVSDEMAAFHSGAVANNLLFLNECGLDPGIDHMSAMHVIDRIRADGGKLIGFESFTGGLLDPASDPDNPWKYKFTWNPRNVVMAGQGTAKYLQDGQFKYIPYQQLFRRTTPVNVPGAGKFEGYANRDSLRYISTYGLHGIKTMLRGTLRYSGFCEAWNMLVQLGCCDDSYPMERVEGMTHLGFITSFLDERVPGTDLVKKILDQAGGGSTDAINKLQWSGLFSNELVGLTEGSPARILEHILSKKWKLVPSDRDLVVMQHKFVFEKAGETRTILSNLVSRGDHVQTAMARTVGLPLAIATRLLATGRIHARGVVIPVTPEFYEPILRELDDLGIRLEESGG